MKNLTKPLLGLFLFTLMINSSQALDIGRKAPSIPLPILEGTQAGANKTINDYQGKLVYVDFWASWCRPCRQSLPILNDLRSIYAPQGFEVVAINVDENLNDALKFLNKYPVDYPILLDSLGTTPQAYNVMGMPTAYLLDREGKVLYKHTGFKKKDKKKIEALIKKHL